MAILLVILEKRRERWYEIGDQNVAFWLLLVQFCLARRRER